MYRFGRSRRKMLIQCIAAARYAAEVAALKVANVRLLARVRQLVFFQIACLGTAVKNRVFIEVLSLNTCLLEVMKHDPIADQVSVRGHQHPLLQQGESTTPEQHGVGVDEPLGISEWTRPHHRAV